MSTPATTRVLAALIVRDGRWLLGLRPHGKRHAGWWEFPGGKVEPGESDADALARELREELDLTLVSLGAERFVQRDGESPFEITFVEVEVTGTPRALEHAALAWVAAEEFARHPLAPSDLACARVLAEGCVVEPPAGPEPPAPPPRPAWVMLTHLRPGERVLVRTAFRTFDGGEIAAGRTFTFVGYTFFPYDDGYTFSFEEGGFRLSGLVAENEAVLVNEGERYFVMAP